MAAIAELTAEQGYEATKIGEIVRRARVARKTLYDNFEGKEEVFLAALDAGIDEAFRRVEEACGKAEGGWEEQVHAGLAALLGYIAEEPALARMCMIESLCATPTSNQHYDDAVQRFVELIKRHAPRDDRLRDTVDETAVGGAVWIIRQTIRQGEAEQAEGLLPELSEFMLGPYRGAAETTEGGANAENGALADSSA